VDKHTTKKIAGRIIPAIATTTALVSGLVGIEFYKVLMGIKGDSQIYRNTFINLAIPFIGYNKPREVIKEKIGTFEYSIWDNFEYNNITMGELIEIFKERYNIELISVSAGMTYLYSPFITE
jgi:ubiquitin-activating enzyme E1